MKLGNAAANSAGYGVFKPLVEMTLEEIATAIIGALRIDHRGFIPEFSVFATNPF